MMRFSLSTIGGSAKAFPARCTAAMLIAALTGGCSASISRFDLPGFSLTDDKKDQTSSIQTTDAGNRGPNYLGNDGQPGQAYSPPRSNSDSRVAVATLPDPPPSSPNYDQRGQQQYDQRGQQPYDQRGQQQYDQRNAQPYNQGAATRTPPPAPRRGESVDVQPGDTLYKLSRRHHVSVAELMDVNGLSNPSLQPGQKIYLPEGYPARHDEPRQVASVQPPPAPPSVPSDLQAKYNGSYTVRQGESVYGISRTYGVPVAELQQANGINDPRGVRTGTVLKVPGGAQSVPPPSSEVADATPPPPPGTSQDPTVINRRDRMASRSEDVSTTSAIGPPPAQRSSVASDKLRWPVNGKIITGFGQRNDGTHNDGINLSVPQGTAVHAAESGVVAYAGSELKGYGNLVLLRHDNGWVTAYAHNDELMVKRGDKVQRGQVIAKAGRTGSVDQPQVHFELRQGSKPVDPVPFLERL
jgi:murein DD-endopeptidase MepM/ murein hydrolase activator NlpD